MSVVRTVKVLVLRMSPPSVDDAIDFLKFFPRLEKLYVLVRISYNQFIYRHLYLIASCFTSCTTSPSIPIF